MSNYPDASPAGGDGGKGGRKSERNVSTKGTSKNNDGRLNGSAYDRQAEGSGDGGPGMPQRKASKMAKQTYNPNEDVKELPGRPGLEEGAY